MLIRVQGKNCSQIKDKHAKLQKIADKSAQIFEISDKERVVLRFLDHNPESAARKSAAQSQGSGGEALEFEGVSRG